MKKLNKTPLATAMGAMLLSGFVGEVSADANPFALSEMSSGYMQTQTVADAKADAAEANSKVSQGGCASNVKPAPHPHKATGETTKKTEGSCGEGKCGGMMNDGKMKQGMESTCGAMMKGKEGSCGMMGGMNHDADAGKAAKAAETAGGKDAEHSCGAMMNGGKGGEMSCGAMMKDQAGSGETKVDADKAAGK
jgi:uncharacterized low-complexity protein